VCSLKETDALVNRSDYRLQTGKNSALPHVFTNVRVAKNDWDRFKDSFVITSVDFGGDEK